MNNQMKNYPEPNLAKDSRKQQMRDLPSPREKFVAVILGITCFVLMYTVVRVIIFIPPTLIQEQNNFSRITRLQKVFREGHGHPWMWQNGSTCKPQILDLTEKRKCAVLSLEGIKSDDCEFPNMYTCKHKLEN